LEATEEFMDRVRRLSPPDPDGSDASKRALQRLYPLDDGSVVRLPAEAADWTRELKDLAKQIKALESRVDELKNKLRKCIGPATDGKRPQPSDGKQVGRWERQRRKAHGGRASESRVLLAMKIGPALEDVAALPEPSGCVSYIEAQLRESIK